LCVDGVLKTICLECNLKLSDKHTLARHINGVHKKIKSFVCRQCPEDTKYKSADRGSFERHKKSVHNKIFDYVCDPLYPLSMIEHYGEPVPTRNANAFRNNATPPAAKNCPALILHGPITALRINVPTGDASQTNSSDEVNQRQPILNETPPIFGEESSSADEKGLVSPLLKGN